MDGFLLWTLHPSGNSGLTSYFPLKILAFETPTPLEFPMTIHRVGMDKKWLPDYYLANKSSHNNKIAIKGSGISWI